MYALVDSIALAAGLVLKGAQTFKGLIYIPDQHQNDWGH